LVGLLGQTNSLSQGHYLHRTAQHRKMQAHIHASSRIWTHNSSVWVVKDCMDLRLCGHWDQQVMYVHLWNHSNQPQIVGPDYGDT